MEEYQHNANGEHGFTRVHEFTERPDAHDADAKEPRQDEGRVVTFDANSEELDSNADAPGPGGKEPSKYHEQRRVGTFEANAEALSGKVQALDTSQVATTDFYVYAWQRQIADFYGMRLRKNVEFGRRLAEAHSIADLLGLQHEYVRGTLLDYASSFYEVAGFSFRRPQQATKPLDR